MRMEVRGTGGSDAASKGAGLEEWAALGRNGSKESRMCGAGMAFGAAWAGAAMPHSAAMLCIAAPARAASCGGHYWYNEKKGKGMGPQPRGCGCWRNHRVSKGAAGTGWEGGGAAGTCPYVRRGVDQSQNARQTEGREPEKQGWGDRVAGKLQLG